VDHQVEQLLHLGLEAERFLGHRFSHRGVPPQVPGKLGAAGRLSRPGGAP
jgi:hypothetical protein